MTLTEERISPFSLNGDAPDNGRAVRLHLGAGRIHLAGFDDLDRKTGQEVYPLHHADNSVEEIVASHVLEHFSHTDVSTVLTHWVNKLKPGGKIRLAVPDFEAVAKAYLAGEAINVQGYVMGGHLDSDDQHGALFDVEALTELMMQCGLERIGRWESDIPGCSQLPISLNLQGFKPSGPQKTLENVRAVMSTPRFGPLMHPRCAQNAFHELRIAAKAGQSCFWHQKLSGLMEEAIADPKCDFVLTLDFDTIFCSADVVELYRLMKACPEVDAVFPLQSKRGCQQALFSAVDSNGRIKSAIAEGDLQRNLLPCFTGHFGLTMFRADTLRAHKRPWMAPVPNAEGEWENGQVDADIDFWRRWREAGYVACLAPKVVVGHLEEVVTWPGKDLSRVHQSASDYEENGIPAAVAR